MDEERRLAIVSALQGSDFVETEEELDEVEESEPVEEESGAHDTLDEEEETVVESSADDDDEVEEGHRVPYDRFKQINDQRREYRDRVERQEQLIAQLQEKLQGSKVTEREAEDDDSFWTEESHDDLDEISMLRQQNEEIQVKFATMELEKEIAAALEQYPNVPENHIWESIAQNGTERAEDIAARYSSMVAEIEEAAIARYLKEEGVGAPDAPPRPSRKQTSKSANRDEEWRPRTTDEARMAMLEYLRS